MKKIIKKYRRWRKIIKGISLLAKGMKLLISLGSVGLSALEIYDKFLKDKLSPLGDE